MAEEATESDSEAFLPVAAAARLLGIPERTARRHAAKLADTDRKMADSGGQGGGHLVRVSALSKSCGAAMVVATSPAAGGQGGGHYEENGGQVADSGGHLQSLPEPAPDALETLRIELAEANQRAAVAEARAKEIEKRATLAEEMARSAQANESAALARLAEADARMGLVLRSGEARQILPREVNVPEEAGEASTPRSWWQRFWPGNGSA